MTIIILIVTGMLSLYAFYNKTAEGLMRFNAYMVFQHKEWWRFFSYGLVHADFLHLAVNLYVLYSFGGFVEYKYEAWFGDKGMFYFFIMYVGGLIISVVPDYYKHRHDIYYNAVGASGAVSAIVFAFMVFEPMAPMGLLFIPVRIPAIIFGLLYLGYSYYMAKRGGDNIGHNAHFWGAVFGFVFTIAMKPMLLVHFIYQIIH